MPGGSDAKGRYRREGDRYIVDLRIRRIDQLFDLRDPSPFRERDLDPGLVEYVTEAMTEIPSGAPIRIAVLVSHEVETTLPAELIVQSFHAHFQHAIEVDRVRVRAYVRQGQLALLVGLVVITIFLTAADAIGENAQSKAMRILREGLTIGGWVAIWRPVEHFLYDWWPFLAQRRTIRRLLEAEVEVSWDTTVRVTHPHPASAR